MSAAAGQSAPNPAPSWLPQALKVVAVGAGLGGAYYLYQRWRGGPTEAAPPAEFICPITRELMNRPVFTSDGHTVPSPILPLSSLKECAFECRPCQSVEGPC